MKTDKTAIDICCEQKRDEKKEGKKKHPNPFSCDAAVRMNCDDTMFSCRIISVHDKHKNKNKNE